MRGEDVKSLDIGRFVIPCNLQSEFRICNIIMRHHRRFVARFLQSCDYALFGNGARRQMAMKSRLPFTARE